MKKAIHDSSTGCVVLLDMSAEEEAALIPTAEEIIAREAEEARQQAVEAARAELLADTVSKMTYAQIESYIDANVTDLASARAFLKKLARVTKALVER